MIVIFLSLLCASMMCRASTLEGLIGWWRFEESDGETLFANQISTSPAAERVGSDTESIISGALPASAFMNENAFSTSCSENKHSLYFSKNGDALLIPGKDEVMKPASFTFECFIRLEKNATHNGRRRIANRRLLVNGINWMVWGLWVENGNLTARFDDGANAQWFKQSFPVTTEKWHHVALTYDATLNRAMLYLDYRLLADEELIFNKNVMPAQSKIFPGLCYEKDPNGSYEIGGNGDGDQSLCGWVDEVRFFDRAIPPTSFLQQDTLQAHPKTVAWFRMSPPAAGTAKRFAQQIPNAIIPFDTVTVSDGSFTNSSSQQSTFAFSNQSAILFGTKDSASYLENTSSIFFPNLNYTNGVTNTSIRVNIDGLTSVNSKQECIYTNSLTWEAIFKADPVSGQQRILISRAALNSSNAAYDFDFKLCVNWRAL